MVCWREWRVSQSEPHDVLLQLQLKSSLPLASSVRPCGEDRLRIVTRDAAADLAVLLACGCSLTAVDVRRQSFRDEQWYVLSSATGGRQFRVNSLGYEIVGRLDGRQSMQEIWDALVRQKGADAPSQHEVLSILSELSAAGMIQSEYSPDRGESARLRGAP